MKSEYTRYDIKTARTFIPTRARRVYTLFMRKTSLVIDDDLIREAGEILGTRGIKETIDRALEEVIVTNARRALIRRMQTMQGLDLADSGVMRSAWRE